MENSNTLQHLIHHPLKEHALFMPPLQLTPSKTVRAVQILARHILDVLHTHTQRTLLLCHLPFTRLFSPTHNLSSTSRIHSHTIPITTPPRLHFTLASSPTSHTPHTPPRLHAHHTPHTRPTRRTRRSASRDCSAKNSSVPREWGERAVRGGRVVCGTTRPRPCGTPPTTTLKPAHDPHAVQHRHHLLRDVVLAVHVVARSTLA